MARVSNIPNTEKLIFQIIIYNSEKIDFITHHLLVAHFLFPQVSISVLIEIVIDIVIISNAVHLLKLLE